jgi:hypothetical protein
MTGLPHFPLSRLPALYPDGHAWRARLKLSATAPKVPSASRRYDRDHGIDSLAAARTPTTSATVGAITDVRPHMALRGILD